MDKIQFIKETQEHIGNVGFFISRLVAQLLERAVRHDMSKMGDPQEHETFLEFTPKLKGSTYGSDEYKGFLQSMQFGLALHYSNNRHHPEHFKEGIKDMTLVDLVEMICDWKAATMRHADGDLLRSIEINQKRFGYSDELKQILLNTAREYMVSEMKAV